MKRAIAVFVLMLVAGLAVAKGGGAGGGAGGAGSGSTGSGGSGGAGADYLYCAVDRYGKGDAYACSTEPSVCQWRAEMRGDGVCIARPRGGGDKKL